MATTTPFAVISHTRRVCSLYKKVLRTIQDYSIDRALYRYNACLMRQKFEENRNIKDMVVAVKLVAEAEEEHFQRAHWQPYQFPNSPGGVAYGREAPPPDSIIDFWDPVEKAHFPNYFKLREQRKKEYIAMWEKKYGKLDEEHYKRQHH